MVWSDFQGSEPAARHSPVESHALGVSTGRVTVPLSYAGAGSAIADAVVELGDDLVVLRVPAHLVHLDASLALELDAYRVLHADTLMYWEFSVPAVPEKADRVSTTLRAPSTELVRDAIEEIFAGYTNHYSANPLLSSTSVSHAYGDWAARHVADEKPFKSITVDDEVAGIATYSIGWDHLEILLAGIRPSFQRKGHYGMLIAAVEAHARELGIDRILISTQAHNYGVQRAWARYGFLPVAALQTFHVVSVRLLNQSELESSPTR